MTPVLPPDPAPTEPTAPASLDEGHARVATIADRGGYLAALDRLKQGHGPIAIDAERASGFRYSNRAYLVQVFRRGAGVFLLDPIGVGDMRELGEAFADEEWIIHAATQDLTCLRELSIDPQHLFDTELCARLLGFERVGLGAVVERLLGKRLEKAHSADDWSKRPLPQSWLVYAALDVELLVDVRDRLVDELERAGKTEIARQEFADVLTRDLVPVRVDQWRRLTGLSTLRKPRQVAVARELWLARDELAVRRDIAPGRILPDRVIVTIARELPRTRKALEALPELRRGRGSADTATWALAVDRGLNTTDLPPLRAPRTDDSMPPVKAWQQRSPEAHARYQLARPLVIAHAERLQLPQENLLTPETLRRIAWQPPAGAGEDAIAAELATLGARPWQISETAAIIADAFARAAADETPPNESASSATESPSEN